jgi:hypothetical protein
LVTALGLSGCAGMVTFNDGSQTAIEHDSFVSADRARTLAAKSCAQAGKQDAQLVTSVNKNPALPAGSGVQVSTYRCM